MFSFLGAYGIYRCFELGVQVRYDISHLLLFNSYVAIIYLVTYAWRRLYETRASLLNIEELQSIIEGTFMGTIFALSFLYFMKYYFSRGVLLLGSIILICLMITVRSMLFYYLKTRNVSVCRTIIYGAGELGIKLYRSLSHSPLLGFLPVAFVDDNESMIGKTIYENDFLRKSGIEVAGKSKELLEIAERLNIDYVLIAISNAPKRKVLNAINILEKKHIPYSYVPQLYHTSLRDLTLTNIAGIPMATCKPKRVQFGPYLIVKRIFDIAVSLCLIICFGPIMALISLAVMFDSPGPSVFVQKRVGLNGRLFDFYKFRSMMVDSDPYAYTPAVPLEKRITKIGRWLRKVSADELPQLWNVLKGDMSLVGPRPEMPFIVAGYNNIQRRRLNIKPGITGLWQISADRGLQIHENIDYDLYYIDHCSFSLDLAILINTVFSAVRGIGAF
jgi:exopolysaccharide biosynthesis polyprenyl glycosylphosphotransferase